MKKLSYVLVPLFAGILLGSIITKSTLNGQVAPGNKPNVPAEKTSYRDVVEKVLPAVVSIESNKLPGVQQKLPPNLEDRLPPEFRRSFENQNNQSNAPNRPTRLGFGSGVIVDPKGVILTNHHVVRGADEVIVHFKDGTKLVSKSVKTDPKTDLAIITVESEKPLPFVEIGNSEQMEIGDRVLAVGAPFGLAGSVTSGIVSGKGRSLQMNVYEDFLQTDAAINPGNSGGPLVNLEGKVVGINTAIKSRTGGFQGVGLAISTRIIHSVMPKLLKDGVVKRGYLGVQVKDLEDKEVAQRLGVKPGQGGVLVTQVFAKTPADKAGIKDGDVILSIAGKVIKDGKDLQFSVANLPLDQETKMLIIREGKQYEASVKVEEQPESYGTARVPLPRTPNRGGGTTKLEAIGIEVVDLTKTRADRLGYADGVRGVLIAKVDRGSVAAFSLEPGILILKVDSTRVTTTAECQQALANADLKRGVLLQVYTPQGGTNFVLLRSK